MGFIYLITLDLTRFSIYFSVPRKGSSNFVRKVGILSAAGTLHR